MAEIIRGIVEGSGGQEAQSVAVTGKGHLITDDASIRDILLAMLEQQRETHLLLLELVNS